MEKNIRYCKMLDITLKDYEILRKKNKNFFDNIGGWFYFANDEIRRPDGEFVYYGKCSESSKLVSLGVPSSVSGAAVWTCESADMQNLRIDCLKSADSLVRVELNDKNHTSAYVTVFNNLDGTESVGCVINNHISSMQFPFSNNGAITFEEASKEEETLPHLISTGEILDLFPQEIIKKYGLELTKKDLYNIEIRKIDERMEMLNEEIGVLKKKKLDYLRMKGREK